MALKVGLTGQIGTGKSTVGTLLQKEGAHVIEADHIVHQLLDEKEIKNKIKKIWPDGIWTSDGNINRKALARQVFQNEDALNKLEALLHPLVIEKIKKTFTKTEDSICVAIVPLLFETEIQDLFDVTLLVKADYDQQLERCKRSLDLSQDEFDRRLKRQMAQIEQEQNADYIINNCVSLIELEMQTKKLWHQLTKK